MKPDKIGISAWVFLFFEADAGNLDDLGRRIRWGTVYPCPKCQEHYLQLVAENLDTLKKLDATEWFRFMRSEISRTDKEAHPDTPVRLTNIREHSYKYVAAILFSYEPKVNLDYCRRVKSFLKEWQPEAFGGDSVDWSSYEALWDVLDRVYPGQRRRRKRLYRYFSS